MTVMFIRITKVSAAKIVESISILYASISINRENVSSSGKKTIILSQLLFSRQLAGTLYVNVTDLIRGT